MKARYLMFFSYIGTGFRSSEKLWCKTGRNYPDPESVQGVLELGLLKLKSLNYPNFVLSSRTDGGVHAICSSGHFDLDRFGSDVYDTGKIIHTLNKTFHKANTSVFVRSCIRVNDTFHARFDAKSRTYLYRLAVIRKEILIEGEKTHTASFVPVEEWKRCHFHKLENFDIEKFKKGAEQLVGYHDFTTFKKVDKLKANKSFRRQLQSITVRPGQPIVTSYSNRVGKPDEVEYWDIEFKSRGFVHNQIRRMVGTLLSVGIGKLTPNDVKVMLQVPSKNSWHSFIQNGNPEGLYLCNVEYDPQDLIYNSENDAITAKQQDSETK